MGNAYQLSGQQNLKFIQEKGRANWLSSFSISYKESNNQMTDPQDQSKYIKYDDPDWIEEKSFLEIPDDQIIYFTDDTKEPF